MLGLELKTLSMIHRSNENVPALTHLPLPGASSNHAPFVSRVQSEFEAASPMPKIEVKGQTV